MVDRGRGDHDLGAVRAEDRDLLLAHLVGHHEDAAVALRARPRSRARRPCCRRSARRSCRPVLSRPSRSAASIIARPIRSFTEPPGFMYSSFASIEPRHLAREPVEPHDRRRPDQVEHARVLARHRRRRLVHDWPLRPSAETRGRVALLELVAADQRQRGDEAGDRHADQHPERPLRAARERLREGVMPEAARWLKWLSETDEATATPTAPPTCWVVLSRPEASPASSACTPARAAIETGMKVNGSANPTNR